MKRISRILFITLLLSSVVFQSHAQYQLLNPGFEEWVNLNSDNIEPVSWHSFKTATGSLSGQGAKQLNRSTDVRQGATGYSAQLNARSIFGIIANGNLTTGRINMGNMSATNAANHNYSDVGNGYCTPFLGRPDSLKLWIKVKNKSTSQNSQVSVWIHDNSNFKDPDSESNQKPHGVAHTVIKQKNCDWTQVSAPFDYSQGSPSVDPAYILVSCTTNETPGKGDASDLLYIDDFEIVYNSHLTEINIAGQPLPEFDTNRFTYNGLYLDASGNIPEVTYTSNSKGAKVSQQTDGTNLIITVTPGDNDPAKTHIYTLNFIPNPATQSRSLYQLANAGFENWVNESLTGEYGAIEPEWWHSVMTAYGALAPKAKRQISQSTAVRNGASGSFCVALTSDNGFGGITSGRTQLNSTTPSDPTNYHYTDLTNGYNMPFIGKPDSVKIWVKYNSTQANSKASLSFWIHDNSSFKTPGNAAEQKAHAIALAKTTQGKCEWSQISIPFDYQAGTSTNTPAYMLVSCAGGNNPGDLLFLDDMEMVYNAKLTGITINGEPLNLFDENQLTYFPYLDEQGNIPTVSYSIGGVGATASQRTEGKKVIIRVTPNDQNETHIREYVLTFIPDPSTQTTTLYQLPNPGFELWENETDNGETGKAEPTSWHSYMTASGELAPQARKQISRSTQVRQDALGPYCVAVNAREEAEKIINGNLTTGRIHWGSSVASDPSNYDFTDLSGGLNSPFIGKPDSVKVWMKYETSSPDQEAEISVWLHDNTQFCYPSIVENVSEHAVAHANLWQKKCDWTQISIPFDYSVGNENNTSAYALVSCNTNKNAGEGNQSDILFLDDFEMVYNEHLASLTVNGTPVADFDKNKLTYELRLDEYGEVPPVSYTLEGVGATAVDKTQRNTTLIIVYAGDYDAEKNPNRKIKYTLNFSENPGLGMENSSINPVKVFAANGSIHVEGNKTQQLIRIYNMQGQEVAIYSGDQETITPLNLDRNTLYIVKIGLSAFRIWL